MFTKNKTLGTGSYRVSKKVTDWDAVFGAIFIVGLVVVILANL